MKINHIFKWVTIAAIITVLVSAGSLNQPSHASADNHIKLETAKPIQKDLKDKESELSEGQVSELADTFMEILLQDIDEKYKVVKYSTKEELFGEFDKVALRQAAEEFVDFYYTEETDGLYITPTQTPPWFMEENDYDMIKKDNGDVRVVQENYSEMTGIYTIQLDFTFDNGWKISSVSYQ